MNVDKQKIQEAKEIVGSRLFDIVVRDLGIEEYDQKTLTMKSLYVDERTPSCKYYEKGCCLHDFSTGKNTDLVDFYMEFKHMTFSQAVRELFKEAEMEFVDNEAKDVDKELFFASYKFPILYSEDRSNVERYFELRGISTRTLDYANVTADQFGVICFNYYDENDILVMVKNRLAGKVKNGQPKAWCQKGADTCPVLYNMNKIDYTKPLVVVEGEIDALAVIEAGYNNVVSVPLGAQNLHWIEWNFDFLDKFNDIILWFDNDQAGISAVRDVVSRIGEFKCKVVKPDIEIEKQVESYYKQFEPSSSIRKTDANNVLLACGRDIIIQQINNAKEIPNKLLKSLMAYDELDIQDMEFLSTGFKNLDRIYGGTLKGTLTLVTGISGGGKTSLCNIMCLLSSIEGGERCMVFSGENTGGSLISDFFRIAAGPRHIMRFDNGPDRPVGYKATNEAKKAIRKFYNNKILLFDDTNDDIMSDSDTLLEQIEYSYKKFGVHNFLIDNLLCVNLPMTDTDSQIATQTEFILKLKKLTRKYPIDIVLVAHARKPSTAERDYNPDMYDIAGSANIPNLADRALTIKILKDDSNGYDNKIIVTKDRQLGDNGKSCKMYYDHGTKRIYSDNNELNKAYAWEVELERPIEYSQAVQEKLLCNYKDNITEIYG